MYASDLANNFPHLVDVDSKVCDESMRSLRIIDEHIANGITRIDWLQPDTFSTVVAYIGAVVAKPGAANGR